MRITELNFEKSWRGGERQTLYNLIGFRNAGIATELVCRKNSALESKAKEQGFVVHSFGSVFGVLFFLISNAKKFGYLHAQTSHILTWCVFSKWLHRKPVIFTRRVNFKPKGFFTKLKYQLTDTIVAVSNEVKSTIVAFCGRNDIVVIPDIVVKQHGGSTSLKDKHPGKYIIGTTAAFTAEKDPFTLAEAINKLAKKRNDFVFIHFGDGPLIEVVQDKIQKDKLTDLYKLVGFSEQAAAQVASFDVFVMTSKDEGLGSSVLDAFINKVPVVSTDAGGLKELLQDQRGLTCSVGDSGAVAEGIDAFLNNNALKVKCTSNAFSYVQQYHSTEYITQQYINLLKK